MRTLSHYVVQDILKNKMLLLYTGLLSLMSWTAFSLEDHPEKGLLTLLSLILLVLPLVAMLFSAIYIYKSSEFIELLVSQPVGRQAIWQSLFVGLSISLCAAFSVGVGPPLFLNAAFPLALTFFCLGLLLTLVFISVACLCTVRSRDKARGIGLTLMTWLYFTLLFDVLVLFLLFQFSAYPIEKPMAIVVATNPIDLARILILLQLDASAMMGYTGAVFRDSFGTNGGMILSLTLLVVWIILPYWLSLRWFKRKDL